MSTHSTSGYSVIGVDIGGTKMAAAVVDVRGGILHRREAPSPSTNQDSMLEAFRSLLSDTLEECGRRGMDPAAVGVGAAGYVLQDEGIVTEAPNIAWRDAPLRELASSVSGLPAMVDNDANCAAAGERLTGAVKGVDDFVYLTLGTGIGGGVYTGGALLRGHRGMASELGHITIDANGPPCGCGNRGCLESFASGSALGREAAELIATTPDTVLLDMAGGEPSRITGELVAEAAENGDEVALRALEKWSENLGRGVVSLIHVFDPAAVVLGGGVSESGHLFIDGVRTYVYENGISSIVEHVSILLSELGNDAGVIGASELAREAFLQEG